MIEVAVVVPDVRAREPPQPLLRSDAPAADAVDVEHLLIERLGRHRRRVVQLPVRLLDDDQQLPAQLLLIDLRVQQRVRLDVEPLLQRRGGKDRVVRCVVVDRARVEVAAHLLRLARNVARTPPLRPLEVHVLQHVADPHQPVRLVEVPRLHVGHDGDDLGRVVLAHQHGQAVLQPATVGRRSAVPGWHPSHGWGWRWRSLARIAWGNSHAAQRRTAHHRCGL